MLCHQSKQPCWIIYKENVLLYYVPIFYFNCPYSTESCSKLRWGTADGKAEVILRTNYLYGTMVVRVGSRYSLETFFASELR
jgi:hypothetical protein